MLPRVVIENTAKQILDFNGSGLSLMEISHRAKDFQPVVDEAVALIKELLDIPEGYLPRWWRKSPIHADSRQLPHQESWICQFWHVG